MAAGAGSGSGARTQQGSRGKGDICLNFFYRTCNFVRARKHEQEQELQGSIEVGAGAAVGVGAVGAVEVGAIGAGVGVYE